MVTHDLVAVLLAQECRQRRGVPNRSLERQARLGMLGDADDDRERLAQGRQAPVPSTAKLVHSVLSVSTSSAWTRASTRTGSDAPPAS